MVLIHEEDGGFDIKNEDRHARQGRRLRDCSPFQDRDEFLGPLWEREGPMKMEPSRVQFALHEIVDPFRKRSLANCATRS
jgi:hypothetical protein